MNKPAHQLTEYDSREELIEEIKEDIDKLKSIAYCEGINKLEIMRKFRLQLFEKLDKLK